MTFAQIYVANYDSKLPPLSSPNFPKNPKGRVNFKSIPPPSHSKSLGQDD